MRRGRKRRHQKQEKGNTRVYPNYRQRISSFNYLTQDTNLIKDFEDMLIPDWKLLIDKMESINTSINVGMIDMQSIANPNGAMRSLVKDLSSSFDRPATNDSKYRDTHESHILTIIAYESKNLKSLLSKLKKYLQELKDFDYKWNKVYYTNYEHRAGALSWFISFG